MSCLHALRQPLLAQPTQSYINGASLQHSPAVAAAAATAAAPAAACTQHARRALHLAPPFLVEDYVPVAQTTWRLGKLQPKVAAALEELRNCRACPRQCGVDRMSNHPGVCHTGRHAVVSSVFPHFGEESVLQGTRGSGTIFFSMCNLRCVFCQNWDISQKRAGSELTASQLAEWMLLLQEEGRCHNVNLVTPEHVVPQVVEALAIAVEKGLNLPVVYNTSSYDSLSSLKLLDGLVDIYMPDFKFWTEQSSWRYCKARDYADRAREAIAEMHRQVGDLCCDSDGLAKRGVLLRHLVMPGQLHEAKAILTWVAQELSRDTYVHIMEQYHPDHLVGKGERRTRLGVTKYDEINRSTSSVEHDELKSFAAELGLWRFEEPPRWA